MMYVGLIWYVISTALAGWMAHRKGVDLTVGDLLLLLMFGWFVFPLWFGLERMGPIVDKVIIKGRKSDGSKSESTGRE